MLLDRHAVALCKKVIVLLVPYHSPPTQFLAYLQSPYSELIVDKPDGDQRHSCKVKPSIFADLAMYWDIKTFDNRKFN